MATSALNISEFRRRRKRNLIKIAGDKCAICGYNKLPDSLEFHHINPKTKKYQLSDGNCRSLEADIEELKKCLLVCANCHREIHKDLFKEKDLFQYQIINEDVIKEIKENQPHKHYCKVCGKELCEKTQSGLCRSCYDKKNSITNFIDRETLKKLIRTLPFTTIGLQYGVSDNAVRKWCDRYNLPRKKTEINKISDKDWESI